MSKKRKTFDEKMTLMELAKEGWTLKELLEELLSEEHEENLEEKAETNVGERIEQMLLEIGVPVGFQGFQYVRSAIELAYEDTESMRTLSKQIYPQLAKSYGTTPENVRKIINYAIQSTWRDSNFEKLQKYFAPYLDEGELSNKKFITVLVNYLHLEDKSK